MFEQIESYQPITITIEASCLQVFLLMTTPTFHPVERENMTLLLCSTAISNHIQHIKFLLFHDPHLPGREATFAEERTFANPHDEHIQNIKRENGVISVLTLPFINGCVRCL
jgi:hypothetical protein